MAKKHSKRKPGRPTKYRADFAEQAHRLCLLGATDADMALFFGVNEDSINAWKKRHKAFSVSVKEGKELADATVAKKLFERATGYEHGDVDLKMYEGEIIVTEIVKHYPPDTKAAIFWLKNRQKDKWRDRQELDHTTKDQPIPLLAGIAPSTLNIEDEEEHGDTPADDSTPED